LVAASKKKVTILHIIDSGEIAGGERYILDLMKNSSNEFKHIVVLPYSGPFEQMLKAHDYRYMVFSLAHKSSLRSILLLAHFIKKTQTDIVHTHGFRANFYGRIVAILARKKHVSTVHVSLFDYIDTPLLVRNIYILLERILSFKTSKFICISKAMREDIIRIGIRPDKTCLIPNGVDLGRFYPRPALKGKKRELGLKSEGPVIGTIGRMVTEKGHVYLVEALNYLRAEWKDLRCLFIGGGPLLPELKKISISLGISDMCIFAGIREDVEFIYPVLDLFVLPSLREPFGLVLLEAMASGVPVIATASGGPLDFIKSDVNGILVPAKDAKAMASKISCLLSNRDKAKALAFEGRKTVERHFSAFSTVSKISEIYHSLT